MIVILALAFEFALLFILKSSGMLDVGDVVATFLILFSSIAFYASIAKNKSLNKYKQAILIGYLLRIALLYFDVFGNAIYVLPNSGSDSVVFYNQAARQVITEVSSGTESFFVKSLIQLFGIIGINRLYAQYFLMMLSMAAIVLTISTIDKLEVLEESKKNVAYLLNLLPNYAILSSIFLRESLVTLFITISACMMINWMQRGKVSFFVTSIVSSAAACLYHSGSIGITIGCILCLLIYDRRNQRIHLTGKGLVLSLILALGVSYVFLRYGESLMGKFGKVDSIEDIANTRGKAGSSYAQYVGNSNNPISMIAFTLPRIVYFLFSPFPWQWRGINDLIAFFFSALFYLVVIKNMLVFLRKNNGENQGYVIGLLLLAFFTTFIFAWGVSNTGTATRHRDKMVCLYALIMALTKSKESLGIKNEQLCKCPTIDHLYIK